MLRHCLHLATSSHRLLNMLDIQHVSLMAQQVREKAMAPHSSTLAWKIPWTEEPVGCSPWGHYESDRTEGLHFHFSLSCTGEGNGNTLKCSCLENPRDRGAWWAAVYGVTESWTRLKQLSSSSMHVCINEISSSSIFFVLCLPF